MKIKCQFHQDDTASMQLYENSYYCFGCGATGRLTELDAQNPYKYVQRTIRGVEKVNIEEQLARIESLPIKTIRGLRLHYDIYGYYLVYPNTNYYVKRLWEGNSTNKYRGPQGHRKPLYIERKSNSKTLIVIEGQFNAATFALLDNNDCISPGAATDFTRTDFIDYCAKYDTILLMVDADAAGVINAIKAKEKLLPLKKKIFIHPMQEDLNDIYVKEGKNTAQEEISRILALYEVPRMEKEPPLLQTSTTTISEVRE